MNATEAKTTLDDYKLARFKVMKSGHATEQDPFPVTDPITGKTYDLKLGKEYLMPKYMSNPLGDCHRPMYETTRDANGNAETDHKAKTILSLNFRMDELSIPKDKYLEENPASVHLFSVDRKLVEGIEKSAKATKTGTDKKEAETDFK